MTVVYRITGDEIGPNGNGAAHFISKGDAKRRLVEYRKEKGDKNAGEGPETLEIRGREQLAAALDDAMGYGAS